MTIEIYKATNQLDNKSYIGFTANGLQCRKNEHFRDSKRGSQSHFHRAIRKYGEDSFEWKILTECDTRTEAGDLEIQLIDKHGTFKNGYNMTTGGEKSWTVSKETRKRMSQFRKGRISHMKGKTFEEIYGEERASILKKNMSLARRGRIVRKEVRQAISSTLTGSTQTEEHIVKRVAAITGNKNGPKSAEAKAKISKALKGIPWSEARWEAHRNRQRQKI